MRLDSARAIADIEFVIEGPTFGSDQTDWTVFGVECVRNRHRFLGETYSFAFDVVHLRHEDGPRESWHVVIVSELWQFKKMKGRPRGTKSLKIVKGSSADILKWLRRCRDSKLASRPDMVDAAVQAGAGQAGEGARKKAAVVS